MSTSSVRLVVRANDEDHPITFIALSLALEVPPGLLRERLERWVLRQHHAHSEWSHASMKGRGTIGGRVVCQTDQQTDEPDRENILLPETDRTDRREEGSGEENRASLDVARALAASLGATAELAVMRSIVATYPNSLIQAALQVALAVPVERLARTRAAYFIGVLRTMARERAPEPSSTPYA